MNNIIKFLPSLRLIKHALCIIAYTVGYGFLGGLSSPTISILNEKGIIDNLTKNIALYSIPIAGVGILIYWVIWLARSENLHKCGNSF